MEEVTLRPVDPRRIADGLPDHVAILRLVDDDLELVLVNDVLAAALEREPGDLVGRRLGDLEPQRVVEPGRELAVEALERGGTAQREVELVGPRGRRVLDMRMIPLGDDRVLSVTRDLTELRETAAALEETQAIARIGHWSWDMGADEINWTPELYRIFGVDPERWPATYESYRQLLHPEDREDVETTIERAVREAGSYTSQHRIIRPDGEVRTLSSLGYVVTGRDGTPMRLAGTAQDITERILAEEEAVRLREAHARHEQGLELNDNVVQGLAVTRLALMEGDRDHAIASLDRTIEAAREIIRSLLEARVDGDEGLRPGDLVRSRGALQTDER